MVTWEKDGYLPADSQLDPAAQVNAFDVENWSAGWLPVPPPQLEVNIGLVSRAAPVVTAAEAHPESVIVAFSKYMDIASMDGAFTLLQGDDERAFALTPLDAEEDPASPGRMLARRFMLGGDFSADGSLILIISGALTSYAGVGLEEVYSQRLAVVPTGRVQTPALAEYRSGNAAGEGYTLSCATGDAKIYYALDASDDWILYDGGVLRPPAGTSALRAKAVRPGWTDSEILAEEVTVPELAPMFMDPLPPSALTALAVTSRPEKTAYQPGESLDLTGLSVTAAYTDGFSWPITKDYYTADPPEGAALTGAGQRAVTISYTENGVTKTASFMITVNGGGGTADPGSGGGGSSGPSTATPGGGRLIGGNTVTTPPGQDPVTNPDGSLTLPGGGTVTTPGGTVITVPPGSTVSKDGQTVTLPHGEKSGSVEQGGKTAPVDPGLTVEITDNQASAGGYGVYWVNPFTDIKESDWFYKDVQYVYTHGLIAGTGADKFSPGVALTRGMIVTVLYRRAGSPAAGGLANPFSDVTDGVWYTDAVKWAAQNGIVSGYGDGRFGPEDSVTRQDLALVLYGYARKTGETIPETRAYPGFTDAAEIAGYAKEAVEAFFKAGVINGKPGNLFDAKGSATRAEVAAIFRRFLAPTEA
jgi:hypothetical protein